MSSTKPKNVIYRADKTATKGLGRCKNLSPGTSGSAGQVVPLLQSCSLQQSRAYCPDLPLSWWTFEPSWRLVLQYIIIEALVDVQPNHQSQNGIFQHFFCQKK